MVRAAQGSSRTQGAAVKHRRWCKIDADANDPAAHTSPPTPVRSPPGSWTRSWLWIMDLGRGGRGYFDGASQQGASVVGRGWRELFLCGRKVGVEGEAEKRVVDKASLTPHAR